MLPVGEHELLIAKGKHTVFKQWTLFCQSWACPTFFGPRAAQSPGLFFQSDSEIDSCLPSQQHKAAFLH